jgi:benzoyl-CoA reductase/2-hydroxyglutaryl-CoA dehydratase subunit BcrC/BadD/HgdB
VKFDVKELAMANETLREENIQLSERLREMQRMLAMQSDLVDKVDRLNRENARLRESYKFQFKQDILSGFDLMSAVSKRLN